jgi:hypothetical protein
MKELKQLSIFAENRPGKIERITDILRESDVNILAMNITSMGDFGVLKFVVDKPELAFKNLKTGGFAVSLSTVLALEMTDRPGGLYHVSKTLRENGVNVDNAYVLVTKSRKKALFVIETKDIKKAKEIKGLEE